MPTAMRKRSDRPRLNLWTASAGQRRARQANEVERDEHGEGGVTMTNPHADKGESDVESDPHVAGARDADEEDGSYVGRGSADDDFGSGETGAEARRKQS